MHHGHHPAQNPAPGKPDWGGGRGGESKPAAAEKEANQKAAAAEGKKQKPLVK
jgi:hypothetical protein